MATMKQYSYGRNTWDTGDAKIGKALFDALNCPLIETELIDPFTFSVNIDNTVLLKFYESSSTHKVTYTYDGVETEIGYIQNYGVKKFTILGSENVLFIKFDDYYPHYWVFCFEKIDQDIYVGYASGSDSTLLSDLTLAKLGTNETYKHNKLLTYSDVPDHIDYIENDALFQSGVKVLDDPNFISVSYCPAYRVVTIEGNNYFLLSNYTAAKLNK